MTIDLTLLTSSTQTWAQNTSTASVSVTLNGAARTLIGMAAAAYLFGQALGTIEFQNTLDGVQLTDGRFEFPPASGQWVSLAEVADALRYKYGVDPIIEFAPGLGLRGYSVPDINRILEVLNREFADQFKLTLISSAAASAVLTAAQATFNAEKAAAGSSASYDATAVATLLNTASTLVLTPATEAELREDLTEGGDLYTDRFGAFYLNGVRTQAMDVAVTSRLLVQDNVAAEYKVLMDELAERNNLIAAARTVTAAGLDGLDSTVSSLAQQYGMPDVLSELTAGQYSDLGPTAPRATDLTNDWVQFNLDFDPGWSTGMSVQVSASSGGLVAGSDYYVRDLGSGNYSFYASSSAANNLSSTSGRIDLVSDVQAGFYKVAHPGSSSDSVTGLSYGFDLVYNSLNLSNDPTKPDWGTGTRFRLVSNPPTGLALDTDYYLKRLDSGSYKIYRTLDDARGVTSGAEVVPGSGFAGDTISLPDAVKLTPDPAFVDGTRVRVATTGAGLTAGVDYYVRSLSNGYYNFFTSAADAAATGSPRPMTGLVNLTGPVTALVNAVPEGYDAAAFTSITALLNTLISNKVRDGDLDQAKLQTLTAQLQNNTEAMTALIKAFTDMNAQLARAI